jgi:hypothetical protein
MLPINHINKAAPAKAGWRVSEFAAAAGISKSSVYELLQAKRLDSVKFGGARIIVTSPADFLASLRDAA